MIELRLMGIGERTLKKTKDGDQGFPKATLAFYGSDNMKLIVRFSSATVVTVISAIVVLAQETPAVAAQPPPAVLVTAENPDPARLPTLEITRWRVDAQAATLGIYVTATFPELPGNIVDAWCYEGEFAQFQSAQALPGGRLELRHRFAVDPPLRIVTTVTPEPGAVEFVARAESDSREGRFPDSLPIPNMCWQVRRAPVFASAPDPYPEFVKRCFTYTGRGYTFLDKTRRLKIPPRPPDDPRNNPPWVQVYVAVGAPEPTVTPTTAIAVSPDRFTLPIIGIVSRDGRFIAALGNGSAKRMGQAWHDCEHNFAAWLPAAAAPVDRRWRTKCYLVPNDPESLVQRVARDFLDLDLNKR